MRGNPAKKTCFDTVNDLLTIFLLRSSMISQARVVRHGELPVIKIS